MSVWSSKNIWPDGRIGPRPARRSGPAAAGSASGRWRASACWPASSSAVGHAHPPGRHRDEGDRSRGRRRGAGRRRRWCRHRVPGATHAQQRAADLLAQIQLPQGDGVYGPDGRLLPEGHQDDDFLTLVMLGDSTSVGYGTKHADDLPGVILARGVADAPGSPGAAAQPRPDRSDLRGPAPAAGPLPGGGAGRGGDPGGRQRHPRHGAAVAIRGPAGRDGRQAHLAEDSRGGRHLSGFRRHHPDPAAAAVDAEPVVAAPGGAAGARRHDAAGCAVAIAKLVSPQFVDRPDLFAPDRFHPSGAGYRRAMDVLLPALIEETVGPTASPRTAGPDVDRRPRCLRLTLPRRCTTRTSDQPRPSSVRRSVITASRSDAGTPAALASAISTTS